MKKLSKYIYNAETLLYEKHEESSAARLFKVLGFVAAVVALVCLYFWRTQKEIWRECAGPEF